MQSAVAEKPPRDIAVVPAGRVHGQCNHQAPDARAARADGRRHPSDIHAACAPQALSPPQAARRRQLLHRRACVLQAVAQVS